MTQEVWTKADGWAWAVCPHCGEVDHDVWTPPTGVAWLWTLYECNDCGAVTTSLDWQSPSEAA